MIEPERFRSPEYLAVISSKPPAGSYAISASAIESMSRQAEKGYPLEICGLLIGTTDGENWQIEEAREVENLNRERAADRFQLDPQGYQRIDRELRGSGHEIIGVYHSHPDCPAKPSPTDLENAWEGFLYPIISVHNATVANIRYWHLDTASNTFCETRATSEQSQ